MLKTLVKVTDISNLSDARYCAGMGVEMLGFSLDHGSAFYISPEKFKEITEWVAGPKFVGEFKEAPINEIQWATEQYNLDYLQVQNVDLLEDLKQLNIPILFKLVISTEPEVQNISDQFSLIQNYTDSIIIGCQDQQLTNALDQAVSAAGSELKIFRSYGISASNAGEMAETEGFAGLELHGTPEERPGFNDYGDLMDILEALELEY